MKHTYGVLLALIVTFVTSFVPARSALAGPEAGGGGGGGGTIEVYLTVKPQDPRGKSPNDAPTIEATVIGGPNAPLDKFTLTEPTAKIPVALKATGKKEFTQGTETIAIALVINGQEVWIGNDDIEQEENPAGVPNPARYLGVLKGLKQALQAVPFQSA
ncbi:MAG: hypothetical protein H0T79_16350, partial [Deltaproteobacteria bacterium]|nr:hypothetical protein [Deltaproteobacteria bacterium]